LLDGKPLKVAEQMGVGKAIYVKKIPQAQQQTSEANPETVRMRAIEITTRAFEAICHYHDMVRLRDAFNAIQQFDSGTYPASQSV
jgi:hypothetical protein